MRGWRHGHCLPLWGWVLHLKLAADDKNLLISTEGHLHLEQMPPKRMLHRRQGSVFALFCQRLLSCEQIPPHISNWAKEPRVCKALYKTAGGGYLSFNVFGLGFPCCCNCLLLYFFPLIFCVTFVELYQEGIPSWANTSSPSQTQPYTQTGALGASRVSSWEDLAFSRQVVLMFMLGSF